MSELIATGDKLKTDPNSQFMTELNVAQEWEDKSRLDSIDHAVLWYLCSGEGEPPIFLDGTSQNTIYHLIVDNFGYNYDQQYSEVNIASFLCNFQIYRSQKSTNNGQYKAVTNVECFNSAVNEFRKVNEYMERSNQSFVSFIAFIAAQIES